jgi:VWFA-related protein
MKSRNAAVFVLGTLFVLPLPQERPTFSVKVAEVQIAATVKDKKGKMNSNLQKEDFILEEDGKPQAIEYFARRSDLALTLGLLVDTSMSQRQVLQEERRASLQFFDQVLRPDKDLAFIISFDVEAKLLAELTSDVKQLDASLRRAALPADEPGIRAGRQGRVGGRGGGRGGGIGTVLYDAAFLAADEILKYQTGRKAIILISDGVDAGSIESMEAAIEAVQKADTVIYSIRYYDENAYAGGRLGGGMPPGRGGRRGRGVGPALPDGKKVLKELAEETGGSMFEVSRKLPLGEIFNQIQEELRSQYILGYTPPKADSKPGFRRISLRTKDKNLKVSCRSGYYAR